MTNLDEGFRPLAGFWFLNDYCHDGKGSYQQWFPSPCGVLVLKYWTHKYIQMVKKRFPSPCGVLVLKFVQASRLLHTFQKVSVPLRGSGS